MAEPVRGHPGENTMKRRFSGILIAVLFLAGVGILSYPHVSDFFYQRRWEAEKETYGADTWGLSSEECAVLWIAAEAYNRRLAEKTEPFSLTEEERAEVADHLNPLGIGKMGYVTIPKIRVDIPIYQGTEEKQLQAGAGWWIGTSLPTGGESTHCVLTAHNGLAKARLFTDLDRLVTGDRFYLTVLDRVLTYEVDQIQVVEPEEREALLIVPGEDLVTLYTCTPYGVNTHRLLVRGHRVETAPEMAGERAGGFSWWWSLPAVLLLAALWVFLRIFCSKRRQGKRGEGRP